MRGKYNGTYFSKGPNAGGGTFHPCPVFSHSKLTKADAGRRPQINSNATEISQNWKLMTTAQRNAWNAKASTTTHVNKWGNTIFLTGYQFYTMVNMRLLANAIPLAFIAYPDSTMPSGISYATTISIAATQFEIAPATSPGLNYRMTIFCGAQRAPGTAIRTRNLKWIATGIMSAVSPLDIGTDYLNKFGDIQAGNVIDVWLYILDITTGQMSVAYYNEAQVLA